MVLHDDRIDQEFLIPKRLTDHIPEDHICYFIRDLVDTCDFSEIHGKYIGTAGMKAYSRRMLTRLVLLATVDGYESSRKIARLANENIVYMWITGMYTPTYRTILNFKHENKELIENLVAISISAARDEGLVKLGVIGIDGTVIKADASNNSTVSESDLELARELINKGLKKDKEEDELYGSDDEDDGQPHLKLKNKVKNLVKQVQKEKCNEETCDKMDLSQETLDLIGKFTKQDLERLETAHQEVEEIKKQHKRSKNIEIQNKTIRVSLTDPYSRFMKKKKGKKELSYNVQNIVDCESGIILKSTLTQDPTDHYQLIPQLENIRQIPDINTKKAKILADNAYNTQNGVEHAYLNHFDLYTPNRKQASENKKTINKKKCFSKANFEFNHTNNHYTCPNKHKLHYKNTYTQNNVNKKVYYTNQCRKCLDKNKCTPHSNYRIITHYSSKYQDLMAQKMDKEENKEIYKKRVITEPGFAYTKHTLKRNTLNNKTPERNQTELNLIATSHNIKRTHNHIKNKNTTTNNPKKGKTKTTNLKNIKN